MSIKTNTKLLKTHTSLPTSSMPTKFTMNSAAIGRRMPRYHLLKLRIC